MIDRSIESPFTSSANDQSDSDSDCEEMIFEAFALLATRPIHEEPVLRVDHRQSDQHVGPDAKSRQTGEQAKNQSNPAGELGNDSQKGKRCRYMQRSGEESHRAAESIAAKPA